jgi:hypothetical protein
MVNLVLLCALVALIGCGAEEKGPVESAEGDRPEDALVGEWETQGVDEALGPVRVVMRLEADGILNMTLYMESGGQRSFPGTWLLEDEQLVLRGVYFGASGQQRVRWQIEGMQLVLENASGAQQEWTRR